MDAWRNLNFYSQRYLYATLLINYLEDDDQFQQSHKNQEKLNNFTIEIESEILAFLQE
jgi:hypothetical protein